MRDSPDAEETEGKKSAKCSQSLNVYPQSVLDDDPLDVVDTIVWRIFYQTGTGLLYYSAVSFRSPQSIGDET
jgi:hypothetical protein